MVSRNISHRPKRFAVEAAENVRFAYNGVQHGGNLWYSRRLSEIISDAGPLVTCY